MDKKSTPYNNTPSEPKKDPIVELEKSLQKDRKLEAKQAAKEELSDSTRQSIIEQIRQIAFSHSRTKQDEIKRLMTTKGAASDPQVNEVLRRYSFFLRTIEDAEFGEVRKAHYCSVHHKFDYCEGTAGGAAAASSASYAPGSVNYRPGSGGAYATSPAKGSTPYGH